MKRIVTDFYVGQPVKSLAYGEGVVEAITRDACHPAYPVQVRYPGIGSPDFLISYTEDGRQFQSGDIVLQPIISGPPSCIEDLQAAMLRKLEAKKALDKAYEDYQLACKELDGLKVEWKKFLELKTHAFRHAF